MPSEQTAQQRRDKAKKTLRKVAFVMAVPLGVLVAYAVWFFVVVFFGRGALPELNRVRFEEAQNRWEKTAPESYNIEIEVAGNQAAHYRVEVRNGEVVSANRNGRPLRQRRTQGTWSVSGMFGTLSSDVENLEKVASGKADANTPRLRLRAFFHAEYGYPELYQRIQEKPDSEVSWKVTRFEVIQ